MNKVKSLPKPDSPVSGYLRKNGRMIICYAVFAVFCLYSVWLITIHEPWRDEAQSWLIARDASFGGMLAQLPYEGHPVMWFLILMPFAKLGFPFMTQAIIHLLFVAGIGYMICIKSPFHPIYKVLILGSTTMLYITNVFARNYAPAVFLILLIAYIYETRYKKHYILYGILISCLANFNVYSCIVAIALIAADLMEIIYSAVEKKSFDIIKERLRDKRFLIATGIFALGFAVFPVTMGTALFSPFLSAAPNNEELTIWSLNMVRNPTPIGALPDSLVSVAMLTEVRFFDVLNMALPNAHPFVLALPVLFLALVPCLLIKNRAMRVYIFVASFLAVIGTAFFYALYYNSPLTSRHVAALVFAVISMYWLAIDTNKAADDQEIKNAKRRMKQKSRQVKKQAGGKKPIYKQAVSIVLAVVFIPVMIFSFYQNLVEGVLFDTDEIISNGAGAAQFLLENGYDRKDCLIVAAAPTMHASILPHLRNINAFLYPYGFRSFAKWQEVVVDMTLPDYEAMISEEFAKNPGKYIDALIILTYNETQQVTSETDAYLARCEILFNSDSISVTKEDFIIFKAPD